MLGIDALEVGLQSDCGLVRAIDGLRLSIERGETFAPRPSRWWANPAAARA